jgi:hypothetical protein
VEKKLLTTYGRAKSKKVSATSEVSRFSRIRTTESIPLERCRTNERSKQTYENQLLLSAVLFMPVDKANRELIIAIYVADS